jgi:hypothetical protein
MAANDESQKRYASKKEKDSPANPISHGVLSHCVNPSESNRARGIRSILLVFGL